MGATTWCSWLGDSTFASAVSQFGPSWTRMFGSERPGTPYRAMLASPQFRAWIRSHVNGRRIEPAPDLGKMLDERGFDGPAREDLRRFEELLRPRTSSLFVGRCVADDRGAFAVAVYRTDRPGPVVRVGDEFFSGVQLSGSTAHGVVLVEPHVLRCVCTNGAVVHVAADTGVYARWSTDDTEGDLEAVVEMGFSGELARDAQSDLRRATQTPLPRLSDLRARGLLRIDDTLEASIAASLRNEEPTLYGLYNAMTRVARDATDVRTAISLERTAGRLLVALVRNPERDTALSRDLSPV